MRDANYRSGMNLRIIAPAVVTIGLFVVALFGVILPSVESSLMNRKRELLRDLTGAAWGILADFHEQEVSGALSGEEARDRASAQIRRLRHGQDDVGYYWISDARSRLIMHPLRPNLENTDVSDFVDSHGNRLFATMAALVEERGAGYIDYMWERGEAEHADQRAAKISYVRGFEPWGWVIGTGIYLDDVRAESGALTRKLTLICACILVIITALSAYMIDQGMRGARRRQKAERDLRWERDFNKSLVDTSAAFFVAIDADGRTMMMNPAMLAALGYAAHEVAGRNYVESFVPPIWHKSVVNAFAKIAERDEPVVSENEVRTKDGRALLVEWHGKRVAGQDGRPGYLFGVGIDITERRRAEAERGQLLEQLLQAQRMEVLGQLAGGVAHDLNNLLTVIFAGVDVIRARVADDDRAREALRDINEASAEAAGLARSLLTFGRETPVEKRLIDLCAAVEESTRSHRGILPSNIELKLDTSCAPQPWVYADAIQLRQVLLNLALHARNAMPDGGTMCVTVASDIKTCAHGEPAAACLTMSYKAEDVADTASPGDADPFSTTPPRGQRSELGLTVAQAIVTEHGGSLDIVSEANQGATITVRLPCREAGASGDAPLAADTAPRGHGQLILVAETKEYIRKVIVSTLRALDYEVAEAADGPTFIETGNRLGEKVELLLIDADLSPRGGIEWLRELRLSGAAMPAVVMTGGSLEHEENELDENTVWIRKPFQMSDLGRLILALLEVSEAHEAGSP